MTPANKFSRGEENHQRRKRFCETKLQHACACSPLLFPLKNEQWTSTSSHGLKYIIDHYHSYHHDSRHHHQLQRTFRFDEQAGEYSRLINALWFYLCICPRRRNTNTKPRKIHKFEHKYKYTNTRDTNGNTPQSYCTSPRRGKTNCIDPESSTCASVMMMLKMRVLFIKRMSLMRTLLLMSMTNVTIQCMKLATHAMIRHQSQTSQKVVLSLSGAHILSVQIQIHSIDPSPNSWNPNDLDTNDQDVHIQT